MKNTSIQQTADKIIVIMQDAGLDYDQMLEVLALAKQKLKYRKTIKKQKL